MIWSWALMIYCGVNFLCGWDMTKVLKNTTLNTTPAIPGKYIWCCSSLLLLKTVIVHGRREGLSTLWCILKEAFQTSTSGPPVDDKALLIYLRLIEDVSVDSVLYYLQYLLHTLMWQRQWKEEIFLNSHFWRPVKACHQFLLTLNILVSTCHFKYYGENKVVICLL